jgi:hypothetical protein
MKLSWTSLFLVAAAALVIVPRTALDAQTAVQNTVLRLDPALDAIQTRVRDPGSGIRDPGGSDRIRDRTQFQ